MVAVLAILYGTALTNQVPAELAEQRDRAALEAEAHHKQ